MSMIVNPFMFPVAGGGSPPGTPDWWMKADAITGLNDDDPVVSWLDSSSAAKHYGQASAGNRPTYKTNIVNGLPVVRFATDDSLVQDPDARTLAVANTLIIVCSPSTSTDDYILGGSGTEGVPAIISGFSSKAFEYYNSVSGTGERETFQASASGFHILTVTRTDDTGNVVGYYDGTQVFSTGVNTSRDWDGLFIQEIGANGNASGSDPFNGDIAEIIHYASVLSGGDLTTVHNYLGSKYAITVP